MITEKRNRASGWKYAKLTGHTNESKIEKLMINDNDTQKFFLSKIGKENSKIVKVDIGGLYEKSVPCVFKNEKTKSKTDMHVFLDDGSKYNVSIKKSTSGQVFLIDINRFILGFEQQYNLIIPTDVRRGIALFWGLAEDTVDIINQYASNLNYELRKHRLVADTLNKYDNKLYTALIEWFEKNIINLTDFCFSRGLVADKDEWANIIWYKNEIDDSPVNDIFYLPDLYKQIENSNSKISYGTTGGGTTIQLPFGFVQWHSPRKKIPGDIQFHHRYDKISSLL